MATIQGIVAGTSIDGSNKIEPQFDALIYDFIINKDGHTLSFSTSGTTIIANGFAIADGVRGFFENDQITIAANGYLYVKFTTHHDETIADTVELEWSATALTETHDNIGSVAGIYRMKVLTVVSGEATVNNYIENIKDTDEAETVTDTIAENATGTTQETTDNSTKVATTAFVNNAVAAKFTEFDINQLTLATGISATTNSITKQGKSVIINFSAPAPNNKINQNETIATIPANYRPSQQFTVANNISSGAQGAAVLLTINTNGIITANFEWGGGAYVATYPLTFNIGYIIA